MTPVIGLLHSTIPYSYQWLKRVVGGLSQDEIDFKGTTNELNSIAQLIKHMTVVQLHWVFRFQSQPVLDELQTIFDEKGRPPYVEGVSLETLLQQF